MDNQKKYPLIIKKREDIFYLTGQWFTSGYLIVDRNDKLIFIGDGLEIAKGVKSDTYKNIGKYLKGFRKIQLDATFFLNEVEWLKRSNKSLQVESVSNPLREQRVIKSSEELRSMEKAYKVTLEVFRQIRKEIIKLPTEEELATRIRILGLEHGCEISFDPIVASGKNSAIPHHKPGKDKLKKHVPIVLDFGFKYRGYCSDFTRTVFIGQPSKKWQDVYNMVNNSYKNAFHAARPGMMGSELDNVARKELKKEKKYFIHSLGHGTGLEVHEAPGVGPFSKDVLENGMVFSIEPGLYYQRKGGVRIEDLVYLEKGKVKYFEYASTDLKDNIL